MYEQTAAMAPLNGSVAMPDYFFRNQGVAWSQLIRLESSENGRAGAKQRATAAFMKYLAFPDITDADRKTIEDGILSIIPAPTQPRGALEAQAEQALQQQQQAQRRQQQSEQQQFVQNPKPNAKQKKKKKPASKAA